MKRFKDIFIITIVFIIGVLFLWWIERFSGVDESLSIPYFRSLPFLLFLYIWYFMDVLRDKYFTDKSLYPQLYSLKKIHEVLLGSYTFVCLFYTGELICYLLNVRYDFTFIEIDGIEDFLNMYLPFIPIVSLGTLSYILILKKSNSAIFTCRTFLVTFFIYLSTCFFNYYRVHSSDNMIQSGILLCINVITIVVFMLLYVFTIKCFFMTYKLEFEKIFPKSSRSISIGVSIFIILALSSLLVLRFGNFKDFIIDNNSTTSISDTESSIIGKWKCENAKFEVEFVFNDNGTASMNGKDYKHNKIKQYSDIKWAINNEKLYLYHKSEQEVSVLEILCLDKNSLILSERGKDKLFLYKQ